MIQRPIDYPEYKKGCVVRFPAIGNGVIVDRFVREDKLFVEVQFVGVEKSHSCRPDELELVRWMKGKRK